MTEPPRDDDRRPAPGSDQPYGPWGQQPYGTPPYGSPVGGPPASPYAPPPAGPGPHGPPQYAPQWQPYGPPGKPARKSRVGLIAGVTAVILLLIAGVVVLALPRGTTPLSLGSVVLDRAAVERDVAVQFEELEGVAIQLTCPADMVVDQGARHECTGTTAAGEEVTLQITIDDEEAARYSWTEP